MASESAGARLEVRGLGFSYASRRVLDSIDPETGGAPTGIDDGFLPVNDETGRGEGHISFRIRPKPETPVGTEIFNNAEIVFDQNDPIFTPTTINTIFIDDTLFADGFE